MSTRESRDRAASRAEARRRSRLAARGELADTAEAEDADAPEPEQRDSFLRRLFPPAPPLPDKPDPMAGFDREGPATPIRERLFLLRRNPWAWTLTGVLSGFAFLASLFYAASILGLVATFVQFGALIAAGWYGWQRPTLYGAAAGVVGFLVVTAIVLVSFGAQGAGPEAFGEPGTVAASLAYQGLFFLAFGYLGGWYGGYLRRRQSQVSRETRARRR